MDNSTCRICLENTTLLIYLFDSSLSEKMSCKIMSIAKIKIDPKDALPDSICTKCYKRLNECLDFINLCQKSDYYLRSLLNNYNKDDKTNIELENCVDKESYATKIGNINTKQELDATEIKEHELSIKKCTQVREQKTHNKKQQCFTCGKIMSSRFRLKTHIATHLKEKPFSCLYCKRKFTLVENLNTHIRIHTGEKPYCCHICGETFAQSSGLVVHKRKHTGETPYQCALCPRSFQTVGNFNYHVRVHTGERNYDCSTCGRAFIASSDLKQHKLTHSSEKPHVCCVCGMRFSRVSNLKRHMRYLHSKDKSFTCKQCPSKFISKTELFEHQEGHKNKPKKN